MSTAPSWQLGLWGTSSTRRIAVSASFASPEPVIGYIVEIYDLLWAVEDDGEKRTFTTPREAAEYGYRRFWISDTNRLKRPLGDGTPG
jgi:hypothetical protein